MFEKARGHRDADVDEQGGADQRIPNILSAGAVFGLKQERKSPMDQERLAKVEGDEAQPVEDNVRNLFPEAPEYSLD
jgi:hypothetical protein